MTDAIPPSVEELLAMKQENEKLRDKLREKEQDIADLQDKITKVQSRLAHTMVQLSITRSLSGSDL